MYINREYVKSAFRRYISAYNAEDPKIRLKIDHTFRVAGLCEIIADDNGADNNDLAWLAGMLHDIGRFEQVRRFNTFSDALFVDHACFGADLLFRDGLLESFVPGYQENMPADDIRILETSIRNHSAYRIQVDLNERERQYCNILRDADKIDIFRVNCDTPLEHIYNVTERELKEDFVSDEVKECFRNRTAVFRPLKKTAIDNLVGHVCLLFELQYPISLKIAWDQGYIQKLLAFRSENPDTQEWFDHMNSEIMLLI